MKKNFQCEKEIYTMQPGFDKHGANGRTVKATAQKTGATVIIKMPLLDGVGEQDMDRRITELNTFLGIEGRILPRLRGVKGVAQLLDQGITRYRGKKGSTIRFNVYEFIKGVNLKEWTDLYAEYHRKPNFTGIQDVGMWVKMANSLIRILTKVHSRKIVHGDLWHQNIIVRDVDPEAFAPDPKSELVLIDFGWAIALDQSSFLRANRNVWISNWAPERVKHDNSNPRWYKPVDIYSLGNTLLFLAAGDHEINPFLPHLTEKIKDRSYAYKIENCPSAKIFKTDSEIKAEIGGAIAKNNPQLYEDFPAISEFIMFCMRPDLRGGQNMLEW
jgi:serine/threonine protein kinase